MKNTRKLFIVITTVFIFLLLTSCDLLGSGSDDPGVENPNIIDDQYEENDTLSTAFNWSYGEQTWITAIQADDDWYEIDLPNGKTHVLVDCRFTHYQGDIDVILYDASGNALYDSYSTTDNEYIDYDVSSDGYNGGIFYIRVYYGDAGNQYSLWWNYEDDGNIDVVIQ